ncbi:MAG: hypothetical protein RR382_00920 [Tannerellaceae bacterium]
MILEAYRRGLLRENYDNGVNSVVRENMLLDTISKDWYYESSKNYRTAQAIAIAPYIDPKKLKQYMHDTSKAWERVNMLLELGPFPDDNTDEKTLSTDDEKLIKAYEALVADKDAMRKLFGHD